MRTILLEHAYCLVRQTLFILMAHRPYVLLDAQVITTDIRLIKLAMLEDHVQIAQ